MALFRKDSSYPINLDVPAELSISNQMIDPQNPRVKTAGGFYPQKQKRKHRALEQEGEDECAVQEVSS